MISEKEYLKALETIKQYKKQLRIGGVVRSAVKKTKTVWLDDTWYGIEFDGEDVKASGKFEFADIVDILLTEKQKEDYIGNDTSREFEVSQKRIDKMFTYINSDNNVWRKR
jgi:hypothetical protein